MGAEFNLALWEIVSPESEYLGIENNRDFHATFGCGEHDIGAYYVTYDSLYGLYKFTEKFFKELEKRCIE